MRTSAKQKQTREAILDATDTLLSRNGYKKMTIDDLAKEVGIGKGSVYLHFTSKEELVLSHIDRIIERLKEKLNTIAKDGKTPAERLQKMLKTRVLHRFESVQHYTQNLNDLFAALRPKVLARREDYFESEARIFAEVIEEGQQQDDFTNGNALEIARMMILATNSLLPFSLTSAELGAREEIESKVEKIGNLLLKGLEKRS